MAPLSILCYSRWPPIQTNTQNSTIIQHRAMILVSNHVFKVKGFIEMVDYGVEGLLDNKIQDGRRLKGKQQNSYYPLFV
jgi:hypothetical protein